MIRVLFVFIGNDGIGVRRVVASFNKGCRISHWLGEAGPGEGFSRRGNPPPSSGPEVRRDTRGKTEDRQEGKRFEGGMASWKGGVRLIGSNKVWVAHAHARFVYMASELSDRQPDYWSIRTCLITHEPNGLWPGDSAIRCVLPLTRRRIYVGPRFYFFFALIFSDSSRIDDWADNKFGFF